MKIALDATPLTVPSGGVRRYTEELTRALCDTFPSDQFWLLSDQKTTLPFARPNLRAGQGPRNMLERRWWSWGLRGRILAPRHPGISWNRFRGSLSSTAGRAS